MVDSVFCENCGVAIAADDRFCGMCGAPQAVEAATGTSETQEAAPADRGESAQSTTVVDTAAAPVEPASRDGHATGKPSMGSVPEKPSIGFWDAAGIAMELLVRGVYVVLCGGIAVLGFQHGEPLIGGGAAAYGLYILCGGKWFIS